MCTNEKLVTLASQWLQWDPNEKTRTEIKDALKTNNYSELDKMFNPSRAMKFGTAGLRAEMGPGPSRMNDLTIIQATQGVVAYVKKVTKKMNISCVIGYDARHNSSRWAGITKNIVEFSGGTAFMFEKITPTPLVPFSVIQKQTDFGIMITASHNPKADNGYKLYWSDGVQIAPPLDTHIEDLINANRKPWSSTFVQPPTNTLPSSHSMNYISSRGSFLASPSGGATPFYDEQVFQYIENLHIRIPPISQSAGKLVYTPVHGVGKEVVLKAFRRYGNLAEVMVVPEQGEPDANFPTAAFPNPEEKGVLDLAMRFAEKNNALVVVANDPDADRLALAEFNQKTKSWIRFSGNDIGTMLGAYTLRKYKDQHPNANLSNCHTIASIVSSRFLGTMASAEGFNHHTTLTGFKFIGGKARDLVRQNPNNEILFAFEEALGYMVGSPGVQDKDGVSAAILAAQLVAEVYSKNETLQSYLSGLNAKYGTHVTQNGYLISPSSAKTSAMFAALRNWNGTSKHPTELSGVSVTEVEDWYPANMISFKFSNSAVITIRTSGTEPKIKYYSELVTNKTGGKEQLAKLISSMLEQWYKPDLYGFTSKL
eukprot:TRINITY_DN1950_c0_g2_i1.p1 TRINITY_DN1950_c0_g2~~TRINITY_DN1950_c0_g2_i1.p1  ORF type:complete len:606 (+),score=90.08 TRINITY_DN1950_c0_g2_i1:33-1820(+)